MPVITKRFEVPDGNSCAGCQQLGQVNISRPSSQICLQPWCRLFEAVMIPEFGKLHQCLNACKEATDAN